MRIELIQDQATQDIVETPPINYRRNFIPGLRTRTITLNVDDEGAEYVHALIKSLNTVQRGCANGQMCMWDAQTGLHADGTPCLYIHGERGPSFPMTDQDSESGQ